MKLPRSEIATQVLHQVGISELCGVATPRQTEHFAESAKHWRYATGERMNDAPGRALERFEGRLADELQEGMWKGISEAITNSIHHAYLAPRNDGFDCLDEIRWWMFSQVRDGTLTVAVCDLGIGIPRSLPIKWGPQKLQTLLEKFKFYDSEVAAVRAALEIGATRTGEENRGRGLPQIWHQMKAHQGATLSLLSNKAMLTWDYRQQSETFRQYDDSMFGTMIIWSVPLEDKQVNL